MALKGLAMAHPEYPADLDTLTCSWYYTWGTDVSRLSDPRYVPMSRDGSMVDLPADYAGYLLVFNEPNVHEPNGCNLKVGVGLCRYKSLVEKYPQAKMIVAGVNQGDGVSSENWIKAFRDGLPDYRLGKPYGYALHGYCTGSKSTPTLLERWWKNMHSWVELPIWITEYNDTKGRAGNLKSITEWIKQQPWIERYACFTNRSNNEPWAIGSGCNLIDWNTGQLTASGKYFATI
jgi:hypothetical protein